MHNCISIVSALNFDCAYLHQRANGGDNEIIMKDYESDPSVLWSLFELGTINALMIMILWTVCESLSRFEDTFYSNLCFHDNRMIMKMELSRFKS